MVIAQELVGIEALIFDLDGTMVHTLGDFQVALQRTMADLDLPSVAPELIEQSIGKGSEHLIRTLLAHQLALQDVDALFERAWLRYQYHYLHINGQFAEVYPGVLSALQAAAERGLPLACLTNKPLSFAKALLKEKALDRFFSQVFGGDSFEHKKPHPLPILKTCEALGFAPQNVLMVGDSSNDAQAAHAAGCPVVLVTYGYNHGQPVHNTPASAWLDTLADLPQFLPTQSV
jgi:phosphoglycolate phosphatase